jgi:dihydroneopterin aldolase
MNIQLHEVTFHGYHGLYEAEKKLGNTFIVNLSIQFTPPKKGITSIDQTIDYITVFELVKERMKIPTPLLETIVGDITELIFEKFSIAELVHIQITKSQMHISSLEGNMSVSLTKTRH